ncbi:MAG: DNA polymerase III subunit alpha [Candidatus Njordarchaeia archaeon]
MEQIVKNNYQIQTPGEDINYKFLCFKILKGIDRVNMPLTEEYFDRIEFELSVISVMGFVDYMLIIADILQYARSQGIRHGAGRGSCCGSLLAYLLGITTIDSIKFNLFFERFLNPGRMGTIEVETDEVDYNEFVKKINIKDEWSDLNIPTIIPERKNYYYMAKTEWDAYPPETKYFIHYLYKNKIHCQKNKFHSRVLYITGLTNDRPLQPLKRHGGTSPDIDIDLDSTRRKEIVTYLEQKYGEDKVAHILSVGMIWLRNAVRDTARALKIKDYVRFSDKIAKSIPSSEHDLDKAIQDSTYLQDQYRKHPNFFKMVKKISGKPKSISIHPAGVVISPFPIAEKIPLYYSSTSKGEVVTQWDMYDVEEAGFLKIDLLGLNTLNIIDRCIKRIKQIYNVDLDIEKIPLNDKATLNLFNRGQTTGLFQLERKYIQEYCKRMGIRDFMDICNMNALIRPGTLHSGQTESYIRRRHGEEEIDYYHPCLKKILELTYGILLFQETIMEVVKEYAGFTLAEADQLRKAIGKKKPKEMAKAKKLFFEKAQKLNRPKDITEKLFSHIETAQSYSFNKSHSLAYAKVSYQSAYLKVYYPVIFMCELLNGEIKNNNRNPEKLALYIDEAKCMGIRIISPSALTSEGYFIVRNEDTIEFGLLAIKNVSDSCVRALKCLSKNILTFSQLLYHSEAKDLRSNALISLINCGAFDYIHRNRDLLIKRLEFAKSYIKKLKTYLTKRREGKKPRKEYSLVEATELELQINEVEEQRTLEQIIFDEYKECGAFISYSPHLPYKAEIDRFVNTDIKDLIDGNFQGEEIKIACLLNEFKTHTILKEGSKSYGKQMAFLDLTYNGYSMEAVMFPEAFEKYGKYLFEKQVYLMMGIWKAGTLQITALKLLSHVAIKAQNDLKGIANIVNYSYV